MIFITEQRPDLLIHSHRLTRTIVFENGRYETDDPVEIDVLRRNRFVTDFSEIERELTSPSPQDPPPVELLHRDELYKLAQDLNIDGRSDMDKEGLVEAIHAAQAAMAAAALEALEGEHEDGDGDAGQPPAD